VKTLFLITHSFPPKNIVGALRPYRLAKHMAKRKWHVVVITRLPGLNNSLDYSLLRELKDGIEIHYVERSKPLIVNSRNNWDLSLSNMFKQRLDKFFHHHPTWHKAYGRGQDFFRKIFIPDIDVIWLPLFLKRASRLLKKAKEPVVMTTSPSHSVHLAGLILAKDKKFPWIADFRDPWDYYLKKGYFEITNPVEKALEEKVVQKADALISTSRTYTKILKKRHPELPDEKFYTITNCFEEEKVSVKEKPDTDKFVISYTGIFYPEKDPFTFFRALRTWIDQLKHDKRAWVQDVLKVQLIGSKTSTVKRIISDLSLEKVVAFIERVPHEQAIKMIKGSDLVLISTGLGEKTRPGWLPSKLFEYLGCKVPILAIIPEGEMADIIRQTNSGYVVTSEDHVRIGHILETEIQRKFSHEAVTETFKFKDVDFYEAKKVTGNMISIIESVEAKKITY
jgi:glycosyltransferase involved in cell wall biosynthesis